MRLQHLGSTYFFQKIQFIEIIHRSQLADILQCIIGWDKAKIFCIVFSIAYIQLGQNTETLYCLDPKYRISVLPIFGWDRIQRLYIAQIRNFEILYCLYLVGLSCAAKCWRLKLSKSETLRGEIRLPLVIHSTIRDKKVQDV